MVMRHVCGPDGESGIRTRSTVLMWMDGQYDVVEVENKDVVHLGNSKVAASWIQNFFLDEELNTWPGSVAFRSQLFQIFICTVFLIGPWLWALLVDIEGQ